MENQNILFVIVVLILAVLVLNTIYTHQALERDRQLVSYDRVVSAMDDQHGVGNIIIDNGVNPAVTYEIVKIESGFWFLKKR